MMPRLLKASTVAALLGIRTQTLAKWRTEGKGPAGAFHLSGTCVVYPEEAVEAFIREKSAARPAFNFSGGRKMKAVPGGEA